MSSVITLITDFGLKDSYVAAVKGAMLSINPDVMIVDITHLIQPQNIKQASYVLNSVYRDFPEGTIHVAVVDPGVGSRRRAIVIKTGKYYFVGPDNGIFGSILHKVTSRTGKISGGGKPDQAWIPVRGEDKAFSLTNKTYFAGKVSATFHGRDIFAPVAAFISKGVQADKFGSPIYRIKNSSTSFPAIDRSGNLIGEIIHIDHFGNLITSITGDYLPGKNVQVHIGSAVISGISRFYAGKTGLLAVVGSSGHLEISYANGSAANYLGTEIGQDVIITVKS
jgi:S-adenosyl-L-methionine hydrolase (adenosine-forming)